MSNVVVALPKLEDARNLRSLLARSGFRSGGVCTSGAQAITMMEDLGSGILICSYKLPDMIFQDLMADMPEDFEMLLIASPKVIAECDDGKVNILPLPFKPDELIEHVSQICEEVARKRRRAKLQPKQRSEREIQLVNEAKELLMKVKSMTEQEAHRYIQQRSMENGTGLVETAEMILALHKV